MPDKSIVIHSNYETGRFFRSTDHCQGVRSPSTYPDGFGPCTFHLPHYVTPRPILPSGLVETEADMIAIYFSDCDVVEIPNPDPKYQPKG